MGFLQTYSSFAKPYHVCQFLLVFRWDSFNYWLRQCACVYSETKNCLFLTLMYLYNVVNRKENLQYQHLYLNLSIINRSINLSIVMVLISSDSQEDLLVAPQVIGWGAGNGGGTGRGSGRNAGSPRPDPVDPRPGATPDSGKGMPPTATQCYHVCVHIQSCCWHISLPYCCVTTYKKITDQNTRVLTVGFYYFDCMRCDHCRVSFQFICMCVLERNPEKWSGSKLNFFQSCFDLKMSRS